MDAIFQIFQDPLLVVLLAIGVFTLRVVFLANRLKSAAKKPTLADMRALEDAKRSLDKHRESLQEARETLAGNLGGARDTLRHYKSGYKESVETRRKEIESSLKGLDRYDESLRNAKESRKAAFRRGFADAKQLVKEGPLHKPSRSRPRKDI